MQFNELAATFKYVLQFDSTHNQRNDFARGKWQIVLFAKTHSTTSERTKLHKYCGTKRINKAINYFREQ